MQTRCDSCNGSSFEIPEHGEVPLAAVLFATTDKILIVLIDSIVCQVHVRCLQVTCLQAKQWSLGLIHTRAS